MSAVEQQVDVQAEQLQVLEEAFSLFSAQSGELKHAYTELKQEAERINLALEEANRELEQKLRELDEANNFQRSILQSIPTAVVVTNLDGTVCAFNPAAELMWGVRKEEAIGSDFRRVMGAHAHLLEGALAGCCRQETLRRDLRGGKERIISSTACIVEDSGGRPIGGIQLDRDMTRLRNLESQLYHQEKLADLGKMAAGLAHEIRKPLNGIKGFASILKRHVADDDRQQRYVGNIIGAVERLSGMLDRLLGFAKPDAVRIGPCDLKAAAEEIAEFLRAECSGTMADIGVSVPDDARTVMADPDKLRQVLLNLAKNGLEALEGPGEVRIEARAESTDGQRRVRVIVADTGRGIPREKLDAVMEPFYTEKENGTGLGLSIVQRILALHDTRLTIDSRPGAGAAVHFVLSADTTPEAP